ncbi:hypothetical protein TRIATDRAFT_302984 [Trichoderma atroviride IMI 206040]|uniref:Uncharacterized protein n=1 Tax=Hypocrea atroviridis (strain ATCC 20476 / IMI 206040) TaxID=452589 RepID=G9PBB9_HYPAI|nr:uncharacterized protein TRIATDRAFT_302984 [Trichoderma atroviride IMI 206040]EHK39667.1 hypothetical protein TRIATDRAFT_302984 [Trichoderma atroviride IMI 206040]
MADDQFGLAEMGLVENVDYLWLWDIRHRGGYGGYRTCCYSSQRLSLRVCLHGKS